MTPRERALAIVATGAQVAYPLGAEVIPCSVMWHDRKALAELITLEILQAVQQFAREYANEQLEKVTNGKR